MIFSTFCDGLALLWKLSERRIGDLCSLRCLFSAGLCGVFPVETCDRFCGSSIPVERISTETRIHVYYDCEESKKGVINCNCETPVTTIQM